MILSYRINTRIPWFKGHVGRYCTISCTEALPIEDGLWKDKAWFWHIKIKCLCFKIFLFLCALGITFFGCALKICCVATAVQHHCARGCALILKDWLTMMISNYFIIILFFLAKFNPLWIDRLWVWILGTWLLFSDFFLTEFGQGSIRADVLKCLESWLWGITKVDFC